PESNTRPDVLKSPPSRYMYSNTVKLGSLWAFSWTGPRSLGAQCLSACERLAGGSLSASLGAMTGLHRGLYVQLVTQGLEEALSVLESTQRAERVDLHPAEAADRISFHLAALVRRSVAALDARQRVEVGARLAREVVRLLSTQSKGIDASDAVSASADVLRSIIGLNPDGEPRSIPLPATPLLDTALLTNAPGEPRIGFQLNSE